ncbi:hypothetical protein BHE74_00050394 [Ensete ventricosum]|nr:hypothetical protein BHE74_00050394 [Ensete ventricosum]
MPLGTRQECIESSLRVSIICQNGARKFTRRRPRPAERLSRVAKKLAGNDGPRSSLSIGPGFRQCSGISPKFAWRFTEGIGKLARNMSGDHRKKTRGLIARMPEGAGLTGVELNWLTKGLVNIRFKPKFEKWREPLLRKFWWVNCR